MNKGFKQFQKPQLCLVTDPAMPHIELIVKQALDAGITMLQVRGPQLSAVQLYDLVAVLLPLCRSYHVPCLVNDRIDVGLALHADGFQLGSRSLPIAVARELIGASYMIGASLHSVVEAERAIHAGADFLLAGTIFPSQSHPGEPVNGLPLLHNIKELHPDFPLLGIGGITSSNAEQVMTAGANGIAVISAICAANDVVQAVTDLRHAIGL